MTSSLFVAPLLAALPVFLVATFLWWQAAAEKALDDDLVDTRFLFWDSPLQSNAESARAPVVSTTASWPGPATPLVATAAR